ncbi:hypothetical protein CERSUDRAFT_115141 [Gelatoporia subvermispora B]|uniref:Uncharacterized protein n=1 Tax=Ceriporiopsis subvermispora (strain B) TaxID=914234 RepID=M2RCP4_CERS8|nr:hypothetical protein CERSUDRAFT_115141 [Gelatoporia subvermispora B]
MLPLHILLRHFVSDSQAVRETMRKYDSVLAGSAVAAYFHPQDIPRERTLQIYTPCGNFDRFIRALQDIEGSADKVKRGGAVPGTCQVGQVRTTRGTAEVLESAMGSPIWPLAFALSTVLQNYIGADIMVVGYPWLTF